MKKMKKKKKKETEYTRSKLYPIYFGRSEQTVKVEVDPKPRQDFNKQTNKHNTTQHTLGLSSYLSLSLFFFKK